MMITKLDKIEIDGKIGNYNIHYYLNIYKCSCKYFF